MDEPVDGPTGGPQDAAAARTTPCLLGPDAPNLFAPWAEHLPPEAVAELAAIMQLLRLAAGRVAVGAIRDLAEADEPLAVALTVRLWAVGVSDTADRLAAALSRRAAEADRAAVHQAAAQLLARYEQDPAGLRRDGMDLLVGSLLDAS